METDLGFRMVKSGTKDGDGSKFTGSREWT